MFEQLCLSWSLGERAAYKRESYVLVAYEYCTSSPKGKSDSVLVLCTSTVRVVVTVYTELYNSICSTKEKSCWFAPYPCLDFLGLRTNSQVAWKRAHGELCTENTHLQQSFSLFFAGGSRPLLLCRSCSALLSAVFV